MRVYASRVLTYRRNTVLKKLGAGLILLSGLALSAHPAAALQVFVKQVDKNSNGTTTYHFAVKTDPGETLAAGPNGDFVTIYNFYGFVDKSAKSPAGWAFSSEEFGRTPTLNGYPMVLPVDVPNTPNLTWAVTKPVTAASEIDGFIATTSVSSVVQGAYSGQVTRQIPAAPGAGGAKDSKQALIGALPTPSFLAGEK